MTLCGCPVGATIQDIPVSDCPVTMKQIQKIVFQRLYNGKVKNEFSASPTLKASWTPFLTAKDGTKVVISPFIANPTLEPGTVREFGGDNATPGGIPIVMGTTPSAFSGIFYQQPQSTITAIKSLQCENVGVYLIDENGNIGLLVDDVQTPAKYSPIPIQSLFVGDLKLGGFAEPDSNAISWKFRPNWSDNFKMVTPTDFFALTDLEKPVVVE